MPCRLPADVPTHTPSMCLQLFFWLPLFWEYKAPLSVTLSSYFSIHNPTKWQTSIFMVTTFMVTFMDTVCTPPFLSLEVQRLFCCVTAALIQCVLISSLLTLCQHRCSDGQDGPFLICDVRRSRALHCSGGPEARGPPFGIWGRYGMV